MKKHASSVLAAALGVLVLAVVAVFAIVLPKAAGEDGASAQRLPALPQKVDGLVALDSDAVPAALRQQIGGTSQITQAQDQGSSGLRSVYGVPAQYKFYASSNAQSLAAVTVLARKPGLFAPDGPPVPATSGQQASYRLVKVSGAVCAEYYQQPTGATGQPTGGAAQLARAHCQLGADGRTYDIDARGMDSKQAVAALKALAAA